LQAANAKAKKAAAASAATSQPQIGGSSSAASLAALKSPAGMATGSGIKNGLVPIKQEVNSQNPPPLHPTSGAAMMQKQQQAASSGQGSIPIVATLDPNRIMPVNVS